MVWTAPAAPVTGWPLPRSAANVKKWEIELQTLRESNARLTTALQESAASVEQWKRQFSICREENDRLRNKVGAGHRRGGAWVRRGGAWMGMGGAARAAPPLPLCSHPAFELPSIPITDSLLLLNQTFILVAKEEISERKTSALSLTDSIL